jgi:two-component system LytT family sensor kinase
MPNSGWVRWMLAFGGWTLLGVLFASQTYIGSTYAQGYLTGGQAVSVGLTTWYVRVALSPIGVALAHRFPVTRRELPRRLLVHVVSGLAWSAIATVVIARLLTALVGLPPRTPGLAVEFQTSLLTYVAVVGLTQGIDHYERNRDREIAASRLEARLATARLDLLRMQLSPHFLLGALREISDLMRHDVARAERMTGDLSELIRLSLRYAGDPDVPLSEEVGFLRRYLDLEQRRFHDRLDTRPDVEPSALDAPVPHPIVNPAVENAVPGASRRLERGRVEVRGRADGEAVVLEIYDDGAGAGRLELPLRRSQPIVPA